jgi:uncharacterized repeat protein (TIGR02543 family)
MKKMMIKAGAWVPGALRVPCRSIPAAGLLILCAALFMFIGCKKPSGGSDAVKYMVTFDADGGEPALQTRLLEENLSLGDAGLEPVSEPEKEGYSFGGWYAERNGGGERFASSTPLGADITVYALWIPKVSGRTVTFDADGGAPTGQTRTVIEPGAAVGAGLMPGEPEKEGFGFGGWYTAKNGGGSEFTASTALDADITVYAKWVLKESGFTVTFNADGGEPASQPRTVASGGTASLANEPVKSGYKFGGWYTAKNGGGEQFTAGAVVSADITVYAKWISLWKVTFDADGETPAAILTVEDGAALGAEFTLLEPTKQGFSFDGAWYTEREGGGALLTADTVVTEDITVYAKWISLDLGFTVTFDAAGAEGGGRRTVLAGETVKNMPAAPKRADNDFAGWYTEQNGGGSEFSSGTAVSANITVYAKWTVTVSFDADGGGETAPLTVVSGQSLGNLLLEAPRENHDFAGWYTEPKGGGEQFTASTPVNGHITVYAKWTSTVSFNVDGGSPEPQAQTIVSGQSLGSLPADPAKTGYNFKGWYTGENGGGDLFTASTPVSGHITVYAKWNALYAVSFNVDGGTRGTRIAENGESLGSLPEAPEKEAHNFGGWYTGENGGGDEFTASTPVSGHITVYAKWTFRAAFNADGGSFKSGENGVREVLPGASLGSLPAAPTRAGNDFAGWYKEQNGGGSEFTASTPVNGHITVYAKWTSTVSFNVDGGSPEPQAQTIVSGQSLGSLPAAPAKAGLRFDGWYTEPKGGGDEFAASTALDANITVYAKWTATVTFDGNGGVFATTPNAANEPATVTREFLEGETLGDKAPDAEGGYIGIGSGKLRPPDGVFNDFVGWYTEPNGGGEQFTKDTVINANITVYALWGCEIFFWAPGAEPSYISLSILPGETTLGAANMPPDPTRPGYTFGGWYTESNGRGDEFTASTPLASLSRDTLYAKWIEN